MEKQMNEIIREMQTNSGKCFMNVLSSKMTASEISTYSNLPVFKDELVGYSEDVVLDIYNTISKIKTSNQTKPARQHPLTPQISNYCENKKQLANAINKAGGVADSVLEDFYVDQFLITLAFNNISIKAEFTK